MVLNFLESIIAPRLLYRIRGLLIQYLVFGSLPSDDHRDVSLVMRTNN